MSRKRVNKLEDLLLEPKKFAGKYRDIDEIRTGIPTLKHKDSILEVDKGTIDIYEDYKEIEFEHDDIKIEKEENKIFIKLSDGETYVGRKAEKSNYVLSVDFGTSSTTVGYIDDKNKFYSIIIGKSDNVYNNYFSGKNIENATILELVDYEKFKREYNEKERRPETDFYDLKSSFQAREGLADSSKETRFIKDLKQWASEEKEDSENRVRYYLDSKNKRINLYNIEDTLKNNEFNPLEIYAYLLGTIINTGEIINLDGKIFDTISMTFPTSMKKKIKENVKRSFEKGLLKSLPSNIEKIKIINKSDEPTAYAASAMELFDLSDNGKNVPVFYSVFDFGGGTSDYSYGLCYNTKKEDRDSKILYNLFNYGDKKLGGENLLNDLVEDIIFDERNTSQFLKNKVKFYLNNTSTRYQEIWGTNEDAIKNISELKKYLRFIWEECDLFERIKNDGNSDFISELENDTLKALLRNYDSQNKEEENQYLEIILYKEGQEDKIPIYIDYNKCIKKLEEKIEVGVLNFLEGLKIGETKGKEEFEKFKLEVKNDFELEFKDVKKCIFLAGNSSKSTLFRRKINELIVAKDDKYEIFMTLGGKEQEELKKIKEKYRNEPEKIPNVKTGVVYGSLLINNGDYRIKNVNNKKDIKFLYNVFIPSSKKSLLNFDTNIEEKINDREVSEWVLYMRDLEEDDDIVKISYTNIQWKDEIDDNKLKLLENNIKYHTLDLSEQIENEEIEGKNIYLRIIEPDFIEYKIAEEIPSKNEEIINENILKLK